LTVDVTIAGLSLLLDGSEYVTLISFISALAAGWTKSRTRATPNENDPKQILKVRLAKGEITKEAFLDLQKLISD
jgi:uncharacterized membrane protein